MERLFEMLEIAETDLGSVEAECLAMDFSTDRKSLFDFFVGIFEGGINSNINVRTLAEKILAKHFASELEWYFLNQQHQKLSAVPEAPRE